MTEGLTTALTTGIIDLEVDLIVKIEGFETSEGIMLRETLGDVLIRMMRF